MFKIIFITLSLISANAFAETTECLRSNNGKIETIKFSYSEGTIEGGTDCKVNESRSTISCRFGNSLVSINVTWFEIYFIVDLPGDIQITRLAKCVTLD